MQPTPGPTSVIDLPAPPGEPPARNRPRSLRRRVLRWVATALALVALAAAGIAWWALDRFVIDHVEISDVAAYEAAVRSSEDAVATGTTTGSGAASTLSGAAASADDGSDETTTEELDPARIEISQVVVGEGDDRVTYYVADVVLDDVTQLRAGFADNKFGTNIVEDTSEIAEFYDAMFAVNGDYYGFRESGIVIRNGVLFRDEPARTGLAIFADGTMAAYDETTASGEDLIAAGAWQTLSFGPALVEDGEIVAGIEYVEVDTNFGNHSIQGAQPRTAIGMIEANHFVFVVVDGRSDGYSRGVTMTELAEIMQELGATVAYNLDGGGSSTMVLEGELVNDPLGRGEERGTSDILYVA